MVLQVSHVMLGPQKTRENKGDKHLKTISKTQNTQETTVNRAIQNHSTTDLASIMIDNSPPKIGIGDQEFSSSTPSSSMKQSLGFRSFGNVSSAPQTLTQFNTLHSSSGIDQSLTGGMIGGNNNNLIGQRLLSTAGVDTQALFRKARDLNKLKSTASTASSEAISSLVPKSQEEIHTLHPNLQTSLEQHRVAILEKILSQSKYRTQNIVEERIKKRIMDNSKMMTLAAHTSVTIVNGRRMPISDTSSTDFSPATSKMIQSVPITDHDIPLIEAHYKSLVSSSMNQYERQDSMRDLDNLLTLAHENDMVQYSNAIQLCKCLASMSRASSSYGNIAALASIQFLSDTFQDHIFSTVKNRSATASSLSGTRTEGGLLGYIHQYVEMEVGRDVLHQGQKDIFWRLMYYAIRCGSFSVVHEICEKNHQVDATLKKYVEELARIGGEDKEISLMNIVNSITGNMNDLGRSLDSMRELYRRAQTRLISTFSSEQSNGDYELAALGLLCFMPMDTGSPLATTIEDYIFIGLWHSIVLDERARKETIVGLADNVKSMGADYFEEAPSDESQNSWAYTMPLLLCHQLKSALFHLANKGVNGLSQAVHLGLALNENGVMMLDLCLTEDANAIERSQNDLSLIVTTYAKSLETISVTAALEYIILIPGISSNIKFKNGKDLSKSALSRICRLILDSKAYDEIAGELANDGSRLASGALDKHFSQRNVSEILEATAALSSREGNSADAAQLLSLGGKYSALLSLLNQKLSSLLVTENTPERNFWFQAANTFYSKYLTNRQTIVLKVLEEDRNLHLGNTFQLLLNLTAFFDKCYESRWDTAWEIINDLDIFPANQSELATKAETYSTLSPHIQSIFHHVVVKSMESLFLQHSQCKASLATVSSTKGGADAAGALSQKLDELRRRATLLLTFSGLISMNLDVDTKAQIAKYEAHMV